MDGQHPHDPAPRARDDGRHGFDFLYGRWQVRNERLRERLVGSTDWEHFDAIQECRPLLDGLGNLDEMRTDWGDGFEGMSLRLFDVASAQWRIWWASNRGGGQLDPPLAGRFEDGRGTFLGHDRHEGRPVLVRFQWESPHANAAHWQQAFSTDEGASWETHWHMWLRRIDSQDRLLHEDAVLELRQYTLQPGQRDALVALFEAEFIEPQEAVGMHVIGQFRDLDAPDRFVWLRGFPSLPARRAALEAFYGGPVWQRHRAAANATMIDSDNVLLLRPSAAGARLLASYVTHPGPNSFPRLPVREGEPVFVWLARFDDVAALDEGLARLREMPAWREALAAALLDGLEAAPHWLRLAPTPRSELR